ncbi:Amino acid ABC transporter, amino acid-binding protein [Alteracholeplasma palmae J233]|uniref:Amino acid ABC transporter, amino acid-binding protein n=1 Tax=Alteracholeplasma palmae (strain ATCC 49389 / J233) TaxID=1318466 RepID=U4KP40_ALTPJ|nr:transporter substrate-binding domain-containing protein [Alteracholeplasma palmae]CCV63970.1 Amino acid ABC transporter, amino acid-binding protein [Alteracholeplasma palmae J233]
MKKILTLIFALASILTLSACSNTNMFMFTLDETFDGYVTMVTSADYPPYENLVKKDNGYTVEGVDIEIAKEIARALKKNLRVIHKKFDFLISDVMTGKADFALAGITPTSARLEQVDFSNSYFTEQNTQVVIVKKEDKEKYTTIDDINKSSISVGAQAGSLQQTIANTSAKNAIKSINSDLNVLLNDLKSGRIQALFTENATADTHINGEFPDFVKAFYVESDFTGNAVAVKKGYDKLDVINSVIKGLKESGKIDQWLKQYSGIES